MNKLMSAKGLSAVFQDAVTAPWNTTRAIWNAGMNHQDLPKVLGGTVAVSYAAVLLMMTGAMGSAFNSVAVGVVGGLAYANLLAGGVIGLSNNEAAKNTTWPKTRALLGYTGAQPK